MRRIEAARSGLERRKPRGTTLAMWLFLLRSAIAMASRAGILEGAGDCCTKTRDCLRAALYIRAGHIITRRNRRENEKNNNTVRGRALIGTTWSGVPTGPPTFPVWKKTESVNIQSSYHSFAP